ncbi:interleukin enhancer-binding factor 2 homolog [Neocloeon triangulifer]|uniref:interleukin enhancer-binding factor 2 homolog n=1 Tax=Neocloeon triangulifer TaxID=2078957 RepID=UPI00286EDD64|nr:interleukin enhancer-binding factor 2 homolog [Neocloeon triangulifer]
MRGRGRGMGRGGLLRRGPVKFSNPFVPRFPFDLLLCESAFPRVTPPLDETALTEALLKKSTDLTPSTQDQTAVLNLVTKLQAVLDAIVVTPGTLEACQLAEVRQVGSFKKGTMMIGTPVADMVVILKTLPTRESVEALAAKVVEDLKAQEPVEVLSCLITEAGFDISNTEVNVHILITTIPPNLRKLNPELHMDPKVLCRNLAAIRHIRWFEDNVHHSSVKVLIRVLRDMRSRFEGLSSLTPWMIDLLAHYSVMYNPSRQALPINIAFKRVLQLLAGGLFLPGSAGIPDPCEGGTVRVHTALTLEQQDILCLTCQTLMRILQHGGYKVILGLETLKKDILVEPTTWNGITVTPLNMCYEKPPEKKEDDECTEDMEAENAYEEMETADQA